jgi:hypothetical protein
MAHVGLPGGYARRGAVARPLSACLPFSPDLKGSCNAETHP